MTEPKGANKSVKDSLWWEVHKLALVPVALAIFGAFLNQHITKRERMQSYLSSVTDIATKTDSSGRAIEIRNNPALRSLVRARTLLILSELDGSQKRQIMEFLANSDIHYQVSLASADLSNANMSGMYLKHVNFRNADLRGANLDGAQLLGANLIGVKTDVNTSVKDIVVDNCTRLPAAVSGATAKAMTKVEIRPFEKCRFDREGNLI
jgi:hypothetical protein